MLSDNGQVLGATSIVLPAAVGELSGYEIFNYLAVFAGVVFALNLLVKLAKVVISSRL